MTDLCRQLIPTEGKGHTILSCPVSHLFTPCCNPVPLRAQRVGETSWNRLFQPPVHSVWSCFPDPMLPFFLCSVLRAMRVTHPCPSPLVPAASPSASHRVPSESQQLCQELSPGWALAEPAGCAAQHGQVRSRRSLLLSAGAAFPRNANAAQQSGGCWVFSLTLCLQRGVPELQARSSCCLLAFEEHHPGRAPGSFAVARKQQP